MLPKRSRRGRHHPAPSPYCTLKRGTAPTRTTVYGFKAIGIPLLAALASWSASESARERNPSSRERTPWPWRPPSTITTHHHATKHRHTVTAHATKHSESGSHVTRSDDQLYKPLLSPKVPRVHMCAARAANHPPRAVLHLPWLVHCCCTARSAGVAEAILPWARGQEPFGIAILSSA